MRISLVRTGGIAGIRLAREVDTDELPAEQAGELKQLVDSAQFFDRPDTPEPAARIPDSLEYRISVSDGARTRAIVLAEHSVPDDLRPLVTYLVALAKNRAN